MTYGLTKAVIDPQAIKIALGSEKGSWNVDVLSLSFGFSFSEQNIEQVLLRYADGKGKIILAAASNDGNRRRMAYPASRDNVIAVNSATGDGSASTFNPPLNRAKNFTIIGEQVQSA